MDRPKNKVAIILTRVVIPTQEESAQKKLAINRLARFLLRRNDNAGREKRELVF